MKFLDEFKPLCKTFSLSEIDQVKLWSMPKKQWLNCAGYIRLPSCHELKHLTHLVENMI